MAAFAQKFTDETLENAPEDATRLLAAIGAVPAIRTAFAAQGMMDEDIVEGRTLLLQCLAAPLGLAPGKDTDAAQGARAALAELDAWDEPNFARFQAMLGRKFPSVEDYVFAKLTPSRGPQAVQGVATFLARLDALEQGSDATRAATRDADKQAVALLARRGLDATERKRLSGLVQVALGPTPVLETTTNEVATNRREALLRLKLWYNEWSTVAHATIRKRSHLIRLGLASRHVSAPATAEAALETAVSESAAARKSGT